jgi:hypothetical protein
MMRANKSKKDLVRYVRQVRRVRHVRQVREARHNRHVRQVIQVRLVRHVRQLSQGHVRGIILATNAKMIMANKRKKRFGKTIRTRKTSFLN